jgi:hypothetical protein
MALSASSLREVIKPELLADYQRGLTGLCNDKYNPVGDRWLPRECCSKHAKFDKRVPGLFKTEYEGDEMIGLCSKTYIVSKTVPCKATSALISAARLLSKARGQKAKRLRSRPLFTKECKFSSKGVSKRLVKNPLNIFKKVIRTGKPASGNNKGFRVRNNGIYSYNQTRCGFSYFYCKRRVLDDGIHTVPLDIVLCPKKSTEEPTDDLIDKLSEEDLIGLLN